MEKGRKVNCSCHRFKSLHINLMSALQGRRDSESTSKLDDGALDHYFLGNSYCKLRSPNTSCRTCCEPTQVNRWMMRFLKTDVHQRQEAPWCPSTSVVCLQQLPGIRSRHQNCCSLRIAALLAHASAPLLRSRRGSNVANRESNFSPSLDQDVPASQFGTS